MSRVNEVMDSTSNRVTGCLKGIGLLITVVIMILPAVVGSLNKRLVPDFPDENEVYQWAMKLDRSFAELFDRITGIEMLNKNYMKLSSKKKLIPLDGTTLVENMSRALADALKKKMDALQRLVDQAEDAVQNYTYDPEIERDDVHWVSMKSFMENDPRLVYDKKFRKGVNKSYSAVHIPLEIYEGYPEILNGLKWSAALDPIFRKNAEEDKNLMWQYFGSQVGFMRTFPANKWKTANPELPDLYDVRRRPWYVHGSSSPKDMLILLDTSGSMHGQNMEIMKIAAKSLLNTLGVNDFVNVAWFSEKAGWVTCFKTFVQANRRNKRVFFNGIDALKDGDMASLSIGLEFAFKELKKFQEKKEDWEGAECHQVIMVFTDGGTEESWDVIEKWNKKKKIRIFLYAVGPHILPYATLKDIACASKGYFTAIPSMGAIRTKIQEYVKVLSRPMVLEGEKLFEWTNFYMDVMSDRMLTTVTLPVYNNTFNGKNQSIVGVMGVDVTDQELRKMEPKAQLGPGGYSFCTDHDGYIVFHPGLPTQVDYLDDPPHYDLTDVEINNKDIIEVRNNMIDRKSGNATLDVYIKMLDKKCIIPQRLRYYYTPVDQTTFSIAIVLPENRNFYLEAKGMNLTKGGQDLNEAEKEGVLVSPWPFCWDEVIENNQTVAQQNLSTTLKSQPSKCNLTLVQRLVFDFEATKFFFNYSKYKSGERENVYASFVMTEGGLTRVFPPEKSYLLDGLTDPFTSFLYKRAIYSTSSVFIVPENKVGVFDDNNDTLITVVKAFTITESEGRYTPGVVGMNISANLLQSKLETFFSSEETDSICYNKTDIALCYLLDDAAFIVATNQDNNLDLIGLFFGTHDPHLMTELHMKGVYQSIDDYNYEARCPKDQKVNQGFRHMPLGSSFGSLLSVTWIFDLSAWYQARIWFYSLISSLWWQHGDSFPEFFYDEDNTTHCITRLTQYYLGSNSTRASEEIEFNNCSRVFSVAKVGMTNLLLVIATPPCTDATFHPPLPNPPVPVEVFPDLCHPHVKYRVRPEKCFAFHKLEDSTKCSAIQLHSFLQSQFFAIGVLILFIEISNLFHP